MRTTKVRVTRNLLAAVVLLWTAFGLFWALMIFLPAPHLALWFVATLLEESSLLLAAFALVGIALASLARRAGARRTSLVAAVIGAATIVLSLVPVAQALRTASAEGVALSLPAIFARPAVIGDHSPETVTYARPGEAGQELKLDVWRPPEKGGGVGGTGGRPAVVVVHGGGWEWGSRSETSRWDVGDTGVAAVAAYSPPTDLTRLYTMEWPPWKPDVVGLGGMRRFLGGAPRTVPEHYRLTSPVAHIDPDDPSTFLVHGEGDQIVPFEQSELLVGRLEEEGVPHRFVEMPWANHAFEFFWWGGWGSQITRPLLDEFLERHLVARDSTSSLSTVHSSLAPRSLSCSCAASAARRKSSRTLEQDPPALATSPLWPKETRSSRI